MCMYVYIKTSSSSLRRRRRRRDVALSSHWNRMVKKRRMLFAKPISGEIRQRQHQCTNGSEYTWAALGPTQSEAELCSRRRVASYPTHNRSYTRKCQS